MPGQFSAPAKWPIAASGAGGGVAQAVHGLGGAALLPWAGVELVTGETTGHKIGGATGVFAGRGAQMATERIFARYAAGLAKGVVGIGTGLVVDFLVYSGVRWAFGKMEDEIRDDNIRTRQAMRIGFHTSDVFHTNEKRLLTGRQESLRAIQSSILNARSSVGREAAMMRRSVDDYL